MATRPPPDDWPGIPGEDWGMGSRVWVRFDDGLLREAMVVDADEDVIAVKLPCGLVCHVDSVQVRGRTLSWRATH